MSDKEIGAMILSVPFALLCCVRNVNGQRSGEVVKIGRIWMRYSKFLCFSPQLVGVGLGVPRHA